MMENYEYLRKINKFSNLFFLCEKWVRIFPLQGKVISILVVNIPVAGNIGLKVGGNKILTALT